MDGVGRSQAEYLLGWNVERFAEQAQRSLGGL